MMSGFLLAALAFSSAAHGEPVSSQALLDAFRTTCLSESAASSDVGSVAIAAGFHAVPLLPAADKVHETGAWQRGDIRLFTLSASTDPHWQLPPACVVRADLGRLGEEHPLLGKVGALGAIGVMEGQAGRRRAHWTLPWEDGRLVQVFIDRANPAHVGVILYTNVASR